MQRTQPAARQAFSRAVLCWLGIACFYALRLVAQPSSPSASGAVNAAASGVHGITILDGQWRFQTGDDTRWADPAFDDSNWPTVSLSSALVEQGIDTYSGYGWYRLKLQPGQLAQFGNLAAGQPLSLLVSSNSVGQLDVFVNGVEAGHTKGMTDSPAEYQSPPFVVQLNPSANRPTVIAIRTWAGPETTISRGLLGRVELGGAGDIAERHAMAVGRQWNEVVISPLIVTFLFLCVAVLGGFLYLAQRHHAEYLWLSLLCLAVALEAGAEAAFGLAVVSSSFYQIFTAFNGRVFMAITLEFILHFSGMESRKFVRGVQIGVLVLPFVLLIHLMQAYQFLSVAAEVLFCGLVTVLLFRAWRRGRTEAGVMLVPFFLAATADSADTALDFAAGRHWLPDKFAAHHFFLGPI